MFNTNTNAKLWQLVLSCCVCFVMGIMINHTTMLTIGCVSTASILFFICHALANKADWASENEDIGSKVFTVILGIIGVAFTVLVVVDIGHILSRNW